MMFRTGLLLILMAIVSCGPAIHRSVENMTQEDRDRWIAAQETSVLCSGYNRPYLMAKTKLAIERELSRRSVAVCSGKAVEEPPGWTGPVGTGETSSPALDPGDLDYDSVENRKALQSYAAGWFGNRGIRQYSRRRDLHKHADLYDCSDFDNSDRAQIFFLRAGGPGFDPHGLDRDGDGLACEWDRPVRISVGTRKSYGSKCYIGPRGGTYTITASGRRNYSGC